MSRHPSAIRNDESPGRRAEAARYISDMTMELRDLAHFAGYDLLAHTLDMAAEEAKVQSECPRSPGLKFDG